MAQPTQVEMANYTIYRDSFDPNKLAFYPERDSDELFDILRAKYPNFKSHSERMAQAVIEFLVQESHFDQSAAQSISAPQTVNLTTTSPMTASFTSFSPHTSTWSSPEMPELVPSSSYTSSPSQPLSRQFSVTTPSEPSPPALEQMTGCFSLSDSVQPRQRLRRKMTEQEKVEYRKRRIVKACEKCSKRKRKCNHNQQEMETVSSKQQKASRSDISSTSRKPAAPDLPSLEGFDGFFSENPLRFDDSFGSDLFQPVDDISQLLEAPLPDMELDDLFAPPQVQWPWTSTPDFTLMDSSGDSFATTSVTSQEQQQEVSLHQPMFFDESRLLADYDMGQVSYDSRNAGTDANRRNAVQRGLVHINANVENQQSTHEVDVQNRGGEHAFALSDANAQPHRDPEQYVPHHRPENRTPDQSSATQDIEHQSSSLRANERILGDGRRTTHSDALSRHPDNAAGHVAEQYPAEQCRKTSGNHAQDQVSAITRSSDLDLSHDTLRDIQKPREDVKSRIMDTSTGMISPTGSTEQRRALQSQTNPRDPISPQPSSLGELGGSLKTITDAKSRTELFKLRRRIPNQLSTVIGRDRNSAESTASSSHALQTNPALQISSPLQTSTPLQMTCPPQERTSLQATSPLQTPLQATSPLRIPPPAREGSRIYVERLSDHVRRRDHFGRSTGVAAGANGNSSENSSSSMQILTAVAGLGCLLLLLSLLPTTQTSNLSLSLLLLALASPVRGAKGTHLRRTSRSCSEMWGTFASGEGDDGVWESREGMMRYMLEWRKVSSAIWSKRPAGGLQRWAAALSRRAACV